MWSVDCFPIQQEAKVTHKGHKPNQWQDGLMQGHWQPLRTIGQGNHKSSERKDNMEKNKPAQQMMVELKPHQAMERSESATERI